MLQIIFLGLIAKLTSVSGDCVVGPQDVNINWNRFAGDRLWYFRLHVPVSIDNNLRCVVMKYGSPVGNISLITLWAFDISAQSPITVYGNATNRNRTSWEEIYPQQPSWTGRSYPIAVDYNRYLILKYCFSETNQRNVKITIDGNLIAVEIYVAYRTPFPDEETVNIVKKNLKENDIEYSQLVDWPMTNCN